MPTIRELLDSTTTIFQTTLHCLPHPVGYEGCHRFWGIFYLSAIVFLVAFFIAVLFILYKSNRSYEEFNKHMQARQFHNYSEVDEWGT